LFCLHVIVSACLPPILISYNFVIKIASLTQFCTLRPSYLYRPPTSPAITVSRYLYLFFAQAQVPELLFPALSHKKIPQEVPVAGYRAFFHGALSAKVTPAKALGYGHFSVKYREGRRNECRCRSVPAINGQERRETAPHSDFRPTESLYI